MEKRRLLNITAAVTIALAIFAVTAVCNYLTPLFADDFAYSVSFESKKPISSFYDIYRSQLVHYTSTNGRTVVHALAQLLLWIGKPALNFINAAAFLAFCLLIYYHFAGTFRKFRPSLLLYIFAALWFLTPTFGGSYLWVMGAANYLYSPIIILLYLIPYRRALDDACGCRRETGVFAYDGAKPPLRAAVSVLWLLCGIIAGWTNENTSLAMTAAVILIIIIRLCTKNGAPAWMWCGLAGNIIGMLLLFLSPAQQKRLASAGGIGTASDWGERIASITEQLFAYLWLPIIIFIVFLTVFFIKTRGYGKYKNGTIAADAENGDIRSTKATAKAGRMQMLAPTAVYLIGAGISVYSMAGSPEFPRWVWSSITALCLIAVGNAFFCVLRVCGRADTETEREKGKRACGKIKLSVLLTSVLLVVLLIFSFSGVYRSLSEVKVAYDKRVDHIEAELAAGRYDVTVDYIKSDSPYSSYSLFNELSLNNENWQNVAVARYFGLNTITRRD